MRLLIREIVSCNNCPFCQWDGQQGTICGNEDIDLKKWKHWHSQNFEENLIIFSECPLPKVEPKEK